MIKSLPEKFCKSCRRMVRLMEDDGRCSECHDDELELKTGCRFGTPESCNHEDCGKILN